MAALRMPTAGLLCLVLAVVLAGTPATGESRVDALMGLLQQRIFQRYQGTAFAPHVSMGNPALFRQVLEWASVTTNPEGCRTRNAQAFAERGAAWGGTLNLAAEPSKVPSDLLDDYAITAWHETMHLIEFYNRDRDGTDNWNERHTYYFEAMLRDVLDPLRKLEEDARRGGATDEALRARWQRIRARYQEGAGPLNSAMPVPEDLPTFAAWSGCHVGFAALEQAYASGSGGDQMRRVVAPGGLLSGLILDSVLIEAQPRDPGATGTTYEATVQFTLEADPGSTWTGNVRWKARIQGPGGKPELNLAGDWTERRPGYGAEAFRVVLPDSAPAGSYTVRVDLLAQGLTARKSATFSHAPPVALPTPSPSPSPTIPNLQVSISAPVETAVGRVVTVTAAVSGGVPPYRHEWTTSEGQSLAKESLHGSFSSAGPRTLTLRVWDQGSHKLVPVSAAATVQVHPKLEAWIEGPSQAEAGKPFTLTAHFKGGKPTVDYIWITPSGATLSGPSVTATIHKPEDSPVRLTLRAMDTLNPPQVAEASASVEIRPPAEIAIRSLEVTPGTVAPGGTARVILTFVPVGFAEPVVDADVTIGLQVSSGTGQALSKSGTIQANTGQVRRIGADFPIAADAQAGPIQATAGVVIGTLTQSASAGAQIAQGVAVEVATEADFVGEYVYFDTTRSPQSYHAAVHLAPGGTGWAREWIDGPERICNTYKRVPHPIAWSWRDGVFTFDWRASGVCPNDGWFSGPVSGTTSEFILTGRWSNGTAAKVRFQRTR